MIAHLGGIVAGFLAPLVVMLTQGEKSPFARRRRSRRSTSRSCC
jgi:hypothetical protein